MSLEDEVKLVVKDRVKARRSWTRRCPADLKIAAYVDGTVDEATRRSLERHFTDCGRCLDEVSFLVRANEWGDIESAPPWLITTVEKLAAPRPKAGFSLDWRWATATVAVTFAIAFAVLFVVRFRTPSTASDSAAVPSHSSGSDISTRSTPLPEPRNPNVINQSSPTSRTPEQKRQAGPVTRNSETENDGPSLTAPRDGSVLRRRAMVFTWRKVPEVAFYEISIITTSGDVIVSSQSEVESFGLSDSVPLQAGAKYFVTVRAHLRDGRTVRSSVVSFHVAD